MWIVLMLASGSAVWLVSYLIFLVSAWTGFFFFSSRRRHTRLTCDWSSDVCSSDLFGAAEHAVRRRIAKASGAQMLQRPTRRGGKRHHRQGPALGSAIVGQHVAQHRGDRKSVV